MRWIGAPSNMGFRVGGVSRTGWAPINPVTGGFVVLMGRGPGALESAVESKTQVLAHLGRRITKHCAHLWNTNCKGLQ